MINRQQIQEIPGALRMTLEKARVDYGAVVRKVRWGDGPVLVCGAGDWAALSGAASYAFESFPAWPVVARPVEVFQSYSHALLKPRTVLIIIAGPGEWLEAQEFAISAKQRGCVVIALTPSAESPLGKLADHVVSTHTGGEADSPAVTVCLHAALNVMAFEASRALKRPDPQWAQVAEEFDQLPGKIEWMLTQLPAMVRSFATELARLPRLQIVGGGFFQYPAWRAARQLRFHGGLAAEAFEASEYSNGIAPFARKEDAALMVSASQSKLRKLIHRCAAQARSNGVRVLSLTDGNDRDLVEGSDLGILTPTLHEAPASTLALFMLEWLAYEVARVVKP